jgi:hypothetical protein
MLPDILICDDSEIVRKQMAQALPTALLDGTAINIEVLMDMSSIFLAHFERPWQSNGPTAGP